MVALLSMMLACVIFPGIIIKTKAKFSGRKGPGILQPWFDIARLLRKGSVYSTASSYIFQIGSTIYFASVVVASFFIPFDQQPALVSFPGDFVMFAYLLGLGRFFLIISALDVSSGFEGMGANREAFYSMLAEPAFFILMGSLAMYTGYTSFNDIFIHLHYQDYFSIIIAIIAGYVLANFTLVETSRLPVDDPLTHLELTMVHEVMVLDHSGFDLGLIKIANNIKFILFSTLSANCFIPQAWDFGLKIGAYLALQILFAMGIGYIESFRARNKMALNAQYILSISAISMILIFVIIILNNKI
ncbi:MAG: NADH-quinone oxidoreductase subunit H [Cytophagales bacterium]|nr:NADH-quinone oxidoreductase subunit H [Cytophagales bacterium]